MTGQSQTSYPKPSPQSVYPVQNVYPTSYPQQTNVPEYGAQPPNYPSSGYLVPTPPGGPLPAYPQPGSPSGYSGGYIEVYPGQNQGYPAQPGYNLYPVPVESAYPYNGNKFGYPEPQYPAPANKKPQTPAAVPTSATSIVSTKLPGYKSSQTPTTYSNKPSLIDIRTSTFDEPETNGGQKPLGFGKNDLLNPSSGSSGYSSSLTPQYAIPTKLPKSPNPTGQETNLVILSSSKPQSSTPLYSAPPKTATQQQTIDSVVPSSTVNYENQFTTLSPDSSTPVNIIPYPLPIVPNPGSCPCYFVPPTNSSTNQQLQNQQSLDLNNLPEGAVIGFIPVVFYPSCGVASKEVLSSKLDPVFPSAYQVPYKCSYCEQSESQTATIRSSFEQVVKQSQLNPAVVIKSPSRKTYPNAPIFDQQEFGRKIKVVRRKAKDQQN